mgnify:CR=1 FL=1
MVAFRVLRWTRRSTARRSSAASDVYERRVHGRAARLLHDGGAWTTRDVEQRLGQALSGGTPPATGAAFIEGFLAGSGTVLALSLIDISEPTRPDKTTYAVCCL